MTKPLINLALFLQEQSEDEEQRLLESEQQVQALLNEGWIRHQDNENMIMHPHNPDVNLWRHPYSGEILLSPKLVEWIQDEAAKQSQNHHQ